MPFIQIHLLKGRTPEKKEALIREVTNTVSEVLDAPMETIRILIQEVEPEHYGIAGDSVKSRRGAAK